MARMKVGLCSISFRTLNCRTIIQQAAAAGLEAIEWGGDVHVPAGDVQCALNVREESIAAGLACESYGTYFEAGVSPIDELPPLLASATALGASCVRIWTGPDGPGSADYSTKRFKDLATSVRRVAEMAADKGLLVATEYHHERFTDTAAAAMRLIEEVNHPALMSYWQWEHQVTSQAAVQEVRLLGDKLLHVHAFNWRADGLRLSLAHQQWSEVLSAMIVGKNTRCIYLEFLPDDDILLLAREAAVLRDALDKVGEPDRSSERPSKLGLSY